MPLLRRTVSIPPGKIGQAWEAVKTHLRKPGTDLHRAVNLWQLMDGQDSDDIPVANWTLEQLPALRMEIEGGGANWFNQVTQKTDVSYLFTLGMESLKPSAGTDFLELLVNRLYPGDQSLYAQLKPLGVMGYRIQATGFEPVGKPSERRQLVRARLVLLHEIRTQY